MNKTNQSISVIIPCYNAERTLEACVRSVILTNYPRLQIILVDDLSTDSTSLIMTKLEKEFSGQICIFQQKEQGGPAKARNAGARVATGRLLFFLDSDTIMDPGGLKSFSEQMLKVDAVVGVYEAEPINHGIVSRYKGYLNNYFFSRHGVVPYQVFDSARAGIRAEVFKDLGGFNTDLRWGMDFENEEFGYRIIQKYKMILDPDIHVAHHFPSLGKLTKTYFSRVSQWMEIFMIRRKFESGGVTSMGTGVSTAASMCALVSLLGVSIHPMAAIASLFFFALYSWGYSGFFLFVLRKRPTNLPIFIGLNIYFSIVLALGAAAGASRVFFGSSQMRKFFTDKL